MAERDDSSKAKPAATAGRLRILPTELGCKGLLLLAALELAFLATAYSNLFFLLIVFSCVLGGLGAVWGVRELRGVRVDVAELPPGPAGHPRPLRLELRAPGRRPLDVAVELRIGKRTHEIAHVDTFDGRATIQGTLPALPRGVATTSTVHVVTRQPFGFFSVRRRWPLPLTIVTHPDPTPAAMAALRRGDGDESRAPGRAGGASFSGLRAFRDGDAPNTVHWAATARRGTPIVKEREHEAGSLRVLRLDRRLPAAEFERALAQATAAVLAVRSSGRPVHLLAQDLDLVVRSDRNSEHAALCWLAAATTLPGDAPAPPQRTGAVLLPLDRATAAATNPAPSKRTATAPAEATP
jgi:uncharacterized protein (DUF58 family)